MKVKDVFWAFPAGRAFATRFFLWIKLTGIFHLTAKEKELRQWLNP